MTLKQKKSSASITDRIGDFLRLLIQSCAITTLVYSTAYITVFVLTPQNSEDYSPYRFCLATATSNECVRRPDSFLSNKISKSPDKLLLYFAGIPERVQQQWRVWVMDDEQSKTIEMTVAEFYSWVDSYRESRVAHEN